ncbi:MAG: mechanosensitive ion channel family protein, partial [Gemmatimonadetes bacterium]|nr:mechanosensitive ion channel family protein [Gemmatimonadota bacterium]
RGFGRLLPDAEPDVIRGAVRPAGIFAMSGLWWFGLLGLGLPLGVLSVLLIAAKFLVTVSAVWMAYRLTDLVGAFFAGRADETESKFDDLLVPLVRKTLKVFIVAFGLVFIADNLNVDISSLLAGLGLGGLAFALAAQDTVKNLFGSVTVLLDKPFAVGDWVVIAGDVEGTVEEVGFRSTRVRTFYNSLITVPNANLINAAVDNLGARTYRRWKTKLSLTYDTPPEKIEEFCEGVRELVRRHPHTRKDYFHVYANEYGAASLDVLVYVFFQTPDWGEELAARHALFLDILRLARAVGVDFAFPTQTLHVHAAEWEAAPWSDAPDAETAALRDGRSKAEAIMKGKAPPSDGR